MTHKAIAFEVTAQKLLCALAGVVTLPGLVDLLI